jgi:flagellar hook-length control protein FliK
MNELSVKPNPFTDVSSSHDKGNKVPSLAALTTSFKELVQKASTNVDTGLNSIAERQGISAVTETRDTSQNSSDSSHTSQRDERDDHQVAPDRNDSHSASRDDNARDDHANNDRREPDAIARDDRSDRAADAPRDDRGDTTAKADRPGGDDRQSNNRSSNEDGQQADSTGTQTGENSDQNPANGGNGQAGNDAEATNVGGAISQATAPVTGLDVSQLTNSSTVQALSEEGVASDTGKLNAASGLATAAAAKANSTGIHASEAARQQSAGNTTQVQANTNGQSQGQADTATKGQSNVQQQAQQLAQSLSDGARMQVGVNIDNEASTLTSRPTATLAAGAALATDSKAQGQNAQQQNTHAAQPSQNQAAVISAAQTQGRQAQGQGAQANAQGNQTQAITQAGTEARGASAATATTHSGGATATTAGGEGVSSTANASGSSQTQQTQQAAQTQQNAAARGAQQGPTAADQVSVRITRALQAGNDRISIRLNPAEMGRVEVRMELAHDGRMTAIVTADNKDTLEMLKRDASDLQKALAEGGLDLDSGDLAFNMRGEDGQTADGGDGNSGAPLNMDEPSVETADTPADLFLSPEDLVLDDGRIDVKA